MEKLSDYFVLNQSTNYLTNQTKTYQIIMILSTPTRQSLRLTPSYNFEILPNSDANDEYFKSLLLEDFNTSDNQDMNRFKPYLEKVIQFIITKRPLCELISVFEDSLEEYLHHLNTDLFPKTSSRSKDNTEQVNRTKVIKHKSRKANDSIVNMGNKIIDFLSDVTHSRFKENEDFINLSHSYPYFCSQVSSFFLCASNKKLLFSRQEIVFQKVSLKLLDTRNGFTRISTEVLKLLVQLSEQITEQITETYISLYWEKTMKMSKPLSSPQLCKVLEWLRFLNTHMPKKRKQCGKSSAQKTKQKKNKEEEYEDDNNLHHSEEGEDGDEDNDDGADTAIHNIDNTLHDMNRLIYDIERAILNEDHIIAIGAYVFDALNMKLQLLKSSVNLNQAIEKKIEKNREDYRKREEFFQVQLRSIDDQILQSDEHLVEDSVPSLLEDKDIYLSSVKLFDSIISIVKLKVDDIVRKETETSYTNQTYPPQYNNMRSSIFLPVQFADHFQTILSYDSLKSIFPEIESFRWSDQTVVHVVIHYPQREYWSFASIVFKKRQIFFHEVLCTDTNKLAISELKRFSELIVQQFFKEHKVEFEVTVCRGPVSSDLFTVTVLQFLRDVLESLSWYPFSSAKYIYGWMMEESSVYYELTDSYLQAIRGILQNIITGDNDIFDVFYILTSTSLNKRQISKRSDLIKSYNLEKCLDIKDLLPVNVCMTII